MDTNKDWDTLLVKLRSAKNRPDGITIKEWGGILTTLGELTRRKESDFNPEKYKAETQSRLARLFIKWYFAILVIIIVYVPAYNWLIVSVLKGCDKDALISIRDTFPMLSGVVTPLLAFVLGHYFKGKD